MLLTGYISLAALAWSVHAAGLPTTVALESWKTLANISAGPLRELSAVALSSTQIATVGGVTASGATSNQLQIYSIQNDSWIAAAPLPLPINHGNVAAVGGNIYLLGGFTVTGTSTAWTPTTYTGVYDAELNTWTALTPLSTQLARGASAVGVYNGTIYLAGGKAGSGAKSVDTVTAFDTISRKWITLPDPATRIPGPRDHVGGAVVGHKFFVVGGRDTDISNVKDTVYVLDLENLAEGWKTSTARMPTARGGLAVAALGSKIYTFGGEGNPASGSQGVFPQTEAYDVEQDAWTKLGSMKTARHGTAAAAAGGIIYVPGGATRSPGGDTSALEAFSP